MTENMKHWDALKTTDPKYTKKVTFGRQFTSINSQWQLQRMTEQFGPIGRGWGYEVKHKIERLHDWYVLAIADVTIWWRNLDDTTTAPDDLVFLSRRAYGPIRGSAPVLEPMRDKGRLVFEADGTTVRMHLDDDAGKKAMTDALTKGLSHLGLSADVFLGLFDDNKYVQRVAAQFAAGNGSALPSVPLTPEQMASPANQSGAAPTPNANGDDWAEEARRDGLTKETRSTYQIATAGKSPGRTAAEFWASEILLLLKQPDFDLLQYREWLAHPCTPKGTKTCQQKLAEVREKHPDLGQAIDDAASELRVAAL